MPHRSGSRLRTGRANAIVAGVGTPARRDPTGPHARDPGPTLDRLEKQIDWYDLRSRKSQRRYKQLKILQMLVAAALPLLAAFDAAAWTSAAAGSALLLLEGVQQLGQYQQNWLAYRSTCEQLRHEKFLHAADAGVYADVPDPDRLLAERLEGLVPQEHAKWVGTQTRASARLDEATSATQSA